MKIELMDEYAFKSNKITKQPANNGLDTHFFLDSVR